jgi:hypothetical protein
MTKYGNRQIPAAGAYDRPPLHPSQREVSFMPEIDASE